MKELKGDTMFDSDFFHIIESKALRSNVRVLKPVIVFKNDDIHLRYNVGTRGLGHDAARWPDNMMTEEIV